jgi:hypothetical protein
MYSAAIKRPSLQQHRLRRAADLGEEREVRHVAGADLDHVGDVEHRLDVARIHQLGHERQPGQLARLLEVLERHVAEALERVRRRPRLERAAAQHRDAFQRDAPRGLERLLPRLHGAGTGDEAEVAVADAAPVDLDHGRVG